jgi:hypothetical protein
MQEARVAPRCGNTPLTATVLYFLLVFKNGRRRLSWCNDRRKRLAEALSGDNGLI